MIDTLQTNVIYCGDNLEVLPKYIPDESVDLVYIDPPFNSSRNYEVFWGEAQERRAFEDRFGDAMTYLDWMRPRIREIHRVLKPTGSFYYHCDWHASHYVKVELDRVFGFDSFVNEIVWHYKRWPAGRHQFQRMHDVILFYSKNRGQHFFSPLLESLTEGTLKRWRGMKSRVDYKDGIRQVTKMTQEASKGTLMDDVWDIPVINSQAKERLGYPTQKPLALLERIISASSNEDEVVLDAFCGCGTTLEASAKHKRRWIGIDFSPTACRVMADRLEKRLGLKEGVDFELRDMPKTPEQLRRMPPFEFQNWAVVALGGIPNKVKVGDYGIDGRLYLADMEKEHRGDFMETLDRWYPIQVKQIDRVGRPDIDKFETAMRRDKRLKGYFIAFGFSQDAIREIKRANTADGLDIVPITVDEILTHERVATSIS
ncbi:MAG: restriction endonuclease [Chloroflexi bacterium]|nr:restriction endonuclease [Chloroflexota bacterium]